MTDHEQLQGTYEAKAYRGRPGTFLLPGADFSPGGSDLKLQRWSWLLYSVQRLLSYNTCRGFQLLRSEIFSWLFHLPGNIELAGSKSRGMLMLTGEAHTDDTCRDMFESFTATDRGLRSKKWQIITFFVWISEKSLLFRVKKWKIVQGTPFTCCGRIMIPGLPLSFC